MSAEIAAVHAVLKFKNATMEKETLFTITSILLNNSDNEISSCDSSDESENEDDINLPFRIRINIHIINCKQNTRTDYVCLKIDRLWRTLWRLFRDIR